MKEKKECPFEIRVPFVAIVPKGHRFGTFSECNVQTLIMENDLNEVRLGNLIIYVIENSEVNFRGILHGTYRDRGPCNNLLSFFSMHS